MTREASLPITCVALTQDFLIISSSPNILLFKHSVICVSSLLYLPLAQLYQIWLKISVFITTTTVPTLQILEDGEEGADEAEAVIVVEEGLLIHRPGVVLEGEVHQGEPRLILSAVQSISRCRMLI